VDTDSETHRILYRTVICLCGAGATWQVLLLDYDIVGGGFKSTNYICYIDSYYFFFEIKDSSGQGAWHGEEEMIVRIGRGVALLGGYRGDASNWILSQVQEPP